MSGNLVKQIIVGIIAGVALAVLAPAAATTGFSVLAGYTDLLQVSLGSMFFNTLVVNPVIVFFMTRQNPYPLVFTCLRESGVTALPTGYARHRSCRRMHQGSGNKADSVELQVPKGSEYKKTIRMESDF